jgi:NAD(P)-dependent dehydrogenase (short-subunit alcohol dehydrogenase family)
VAEFDQAAVGDVREHDAMADISTTTTTTALTGRVALVAGATRGAGRAIAVELARAGAFVYATGRSSRKTGPSEIDRPETIEETGDLMAAAGGSGRALRVDHLDPDAVGGLVTRIREDHGRLDVLVNDIFGGDRYAQWDKKLWDHDLQGGMRMLRMGIDTHLITSAKAIPLLLESDRGLLIEMTDGTPEHNRAFREGVGFYYDLVKAAVARITLGLSAELAGTTVTAMSVTPGWIRSEQMLEGFGVTEDNWRDAAKGELEEFGISETPTYVARGIAALAADPGVGRYAGDTLTSAELARVYGVTDVDGSRPDCWRYIAEVRNRGHGHCVERYR